MKKICILGSTGSVGTNTLNVVREHPEQFQIVGLSAGQNITLLCEQIKEFRPRIVSVANKDLAAEIRLKIDQDVVITYGEEGIIEVATHSEANYVVSSLVGIAGLAPTIAAIKAGKDIGLANKETLVSAGHIVMNLVKEYNVRLLPIDSEHSAIFQCLQGERYEDIEKIIITASGGALRHLERDQLKNVTLKEALNHPNWKMGAKITIDSATMMNKGLEVIEAHWLFSLPYSHIDVLIHHESIIHSMIEFKDGAVMAQLGTPDMKVPIQYALTYPGRAPLNTERLSLAKIGKLHFRAMDFDRYPAMRLTYQVGTAGGTYPTVFNAVNEVLVEQILLEKMPIHLLEEGIEQILDVHQAISNPTLEEILEADQWARAEIGKRIKNLLRI